MQNLAIRYTLIALLALGLATVFYYRQYRPPVRSDQMSNLEYALQSHEYNDVLFMGASRSLRQFSPAVFDSVAGVKAYNLGIDQTGIVETKMLLRGYLQSHPAPKTIFLSIDVSRFMFNTESAGPYNIDEYFEFLNDTLVYSELSRYNWRYKYHSAARWLYAFYPIQKMMAQSDRDKRAAFLAGRQRIVPSELTAKNRGYLPVAENWNDADEKELIDQRAQPVHADVTEEGFQLLDDFCRLALNHQIKVIFVYSPLYREIRLPDNQAEVVGRVKAIGARYGIPYWDYTGSPLANSKANFYDPWHFNARVAKQFSIVVATDFKHYLNPDSGSVSYRRESN